jgi:type II secretory pathway pseudopilin PulG
MRARSRQSAVTLTEMTVVIAVVALLVVFGLPAIRAFINSFQSEGGARAMISAALASARAIAAREQHSVGIRFQKAYETKGPLEAAQYMIFIVQEEPGKMGGLTIGFRAVEGIEPIKLPDSVGVMDLRVRMNSLDEEDANDQDIRASDLEGPDNVRDTSIRDTTSFSIIFSPSGRLVVQRLRVRNRDGKFRPTSKTDSMDSVFNGEDNIRDNNIGMFVQDDYAHLGLAEEWSRKKFVIYNRDELKSVLQSATPWRYAEYLDRLRESKIYINPYTGTLINK